MNKGFFDRHFWPIVIALGLVISFLIGFMSFQSIYSETSERFLNTVEYIKKQSLTFDSFNDASATKSLMRSIENASQLARDIEYDKGITSEEQLEKHASDLRLTAAIVLDEKGNLVSEYSTDGIGYEELKNVICDTPSLDVVLYPTKVYTVRVNLEDDSYADVGCAARLDKPGVVVSVYHTSQQFANRYTLSLQSLLDGYEGVNSGTIIIEKEGKVVASNTVNDPNVGAIQISDHDQRIVQFIKEQCEPGTLGIINDGSGAYYFGTFGKARDYFVYTYTDARKLFHRVGSSVIISTLVYAALVILYLMFRRRSQNRYLNELVKKERHYNGELKKLAQKAQSANNAKTEFLQRMSHDIRTPINGIRGMVEVGNAYADDLEKQSECREKVWTASGLLLDLVNEVLDLSKLENGEAELDLRPIDLKKLNKEVCEMLDRQAEEHHISIECNQEGIEHPYVIASGLHVKRLLMNIASNSVKYNKPGGFVRFVCREVAYDGTKATYEVVISDNGIGMSKEYQKHLFEPFSRENQSVGLKSSGSGLGTVITKQLVKQMGGTISYESVLGEGTTCTVVLPFEVADKSSVVNRDSSSAEEVTLEGMHILLVEDNELNREIAQFVLDSAGAKVVHATNGEEAIKAFNESAVNEFDAVLMDIMMPGIDGYEATRAIRKLDRKDANNIPIIAMSANAFGDDRRRSREAGMDEHLAKPLDSAELVKVLARLIRARCS